MSTSYDRWLVLGLVISAWARSAFVESYHELMNMEISFRLHMLQLSMGSQEGWLDDWVRAGTSYRKLGSRTRTGLVLHASFILHSLLAWALTSYCWISRPNSSPSSAPEIGSRISTHWSITAVSWALSWTANPYHQRCCCPSKWTMVYSFDFLDFYEVDQCLLVRAYDLFQQVQYIMAFLQKFSN